LVLIATIGAALFVSAGITVFLPATASAYATIEGPPVFSTASGLPDGRVYEQVSPANKSGNEAGAKTNQENDAGEQHYALASANGSSVLFEGTGPMGQEDPSPYNFYFVATRTSSGWKTRSVLPPIQQSANEVTGVLNTKLEYIDPSPDLSHVMFEAGRGTYAASFSATCEYGQIYLSGADPFVSARWLERPSPEVEDPIGNCANEQEAGAPVGGTPNFSTVYFTFPGTLLSEDAFRAPHVQGEHEVEAWGFYEAHEGELREAGVLPDGKLDPFGAVPAASGHSRALAGNEVSADGSRAFFVSPDPASCEGSVGPYGEPIGKNDCTVDPPELYVRENGEKTLLVSRDTLLPETDGLPASAPSGVLQTPSPVYNRNLRLKQFSASYVFASPDGSQAFFQSEDDLTRPAEEASPGTSPKTYDFDVNTGTLTYLPNVAGQIVATDTDGSSFAFVRPEAGSSPPELDLWSDGPGDGTVTPIAQLPGPPLSVQGASVQTEKPRVSVAQMSSDGSAVVFLSAYPVPGGFNSGTNLAQIYRYDVSTNTLGCVSCAPPGVTPTGSASMSPLQWSEEEETATQAFYIRGMVNQRGISASGERIFFDTPSHLVPQDTNTGSSAVVEGILEPNREVYEWENGVVYLISSGKGTHSSFYLDNSANGEDVFFATTEGLVPGDTDGAYDVYDARVVHPGESTAGAVPCEGSVCQGPPNVPSPLTPPASATFSGLGNPTPESAVTPPPAKTTTKTVKCKKGYVKQKNKCLKVKTRKKAKKSNRRGK